MPKKTLLYGSLIATLLLHPAPSEGFDITSYVMSTVGAGVAIYGLVQGDTTLAIVGVTVSAVCSTSGIGMGVLALSIMGADQVQSIEQELILGEGPHIDAIRVGLKLSTEEVQEIYDQSAKQIGHQPITDEDYIRVGQIFSSNLYQQIQLSPDVAHSYLRTLYTETSSNMSPQHYVTELSSLLGVERNDLHHSLNQFFNQQFEQSLETNANVVLSKEVILQQDSVHTLHELAFFIEKVHAEEIEKQVEILSVLHQQNQVTLPN